MARYRVFLDTAGTAQIKYAGHAIAIHRMDPNLAVKIAADRKGLTAVGRLVEEGVRTNATLIFNPTRAIGAAAAGAHRVAVPYRVFEATMGRPLTELGIERFTEEHARTLRADGDRGGGA